MIIGSLVIQLNVSIIRFLSFEAKCVIFCHSFETAIIFSYYYWVILYGYNAIGKQTKEFKSLLDLSFPTLFSWAIFSNVVDLLLTISELRVEFILNFYKGWRFSDKINKYFKWEALKWQKTFMFANFVKASKLLLFLF